MAKCDLPDCEIKEALPFKCRYCGKVFCTKHRLPENHNCEQLHLGKSPLSTKSDLIDKSNGETEDRDLEKESFVTYDFVDENTDSYYYTADEEGQPLRVKSAKQRLSGRFTSTRLGDSFSTGYEVLDIMIGTIVVILSFGFTAIFMSSVPWIYSGIIIGIILVSYLSSIIPQKLLVRRNGFESRYVLTWIGFLFTLITIISPFKYLSPGTLFIPQIDYMQKKQAGIISSIGSIINVSLGICCIFLGIFLSEPLIAIVFISGAFIVSMLTIFNLIPLNFSPGKRVLNWSWIIFLALLLPAIGIFITAILFGVLGIEIL